MDLFNYFGHHENESGVLSLVGEGFQTIKLPFNPESFTFDVDDDPMDSSVSCNPTEHDKVHVGISKDRGSYILVIKWKVFRTKNIHWSIKSY